MPQPSDELNVKVSEEYETKKKESRIGLARIGELKYQIVGDMICRVQVSFHELRFTGGSVSTWHLKQEGL